jgi:hypothetical protein
MGGKPALRVLVQDSPDIRASLIGQETRARAGSLLDARVRDSFGEITIEIAADPALSWCLQTAGLPLSSEQRNQASAHGPARVGAGHMPVGEVDIVVLSTQPLLTSAWREHRSSGHLVTPPDDWKHSWPAAQQSWLLGQFAPVEMPKIERIADCLRRMIVAVKEQLGAHLLIYNCSPLDPADQTHNYHGRPETPEERVRKANLALMKLSVETGIAVVDVERVVAKLGGAEIPRRFAYPDRAAAAIGDEVTRVLGQIGFFEVRPLMLQIGVGTG